jgi:hypothetical protein
MQRWEQLTGGFAGWVAGSEGCSSNVSLRSLYPAHWYT